MPIVARRDIFATRRKADGMDCRHCRDDDAADRKPVNPALIARPRSDFRRGGNRYQPGQEALSRRSRACYRKRKNRTPKTKKSGRLQSSVDLDHHRQRALLRGDDREDGCEAPFCSEGRSEEPMRFSSHRQGHRATGCFVHPPRQRVASQSAMPSIDEIPWLGINPSPLIVRSQKAAPSDSSVVPGKIRSGWKHIRASRVSHSRACLRFKHECNE